jgi:hypothetical protein
MTRSAEAVAAQPSLTDRPGKFGRIAINGSSPSLKRRRNCIEPRGDLRESPTNRVWETEAESYPICCIAHDFNNLLGVITLNLELAREHAGGSELRRLIDEALEAAWQGAELTVRIAGNARRPQP